MELAGIIHKFKRKILILGDSHSSVFESINYKIFKKYYFDVVLAYGASSRGICNMNSQSGALRIFKDKLKKINAIEYEYVGVMLGEVDCGSVIWYKQEQNKSDLEKEIDESIKSQFEFIQSELVQLFEPKKIIVFGPNLPTLVNGSLKSNIPHLRREVSSSLHERTELTLKYNKALRERSEHQRYNYIDIIKETMNKNTSLIDEGYLHEDLIDHHVSNKKTWKIWYNKIIQLNKKTYN